MGVYVRCFSPYVGSLFFGQKKEKTKNKMAPSEHLRNESFKGNSRANNGPKGLVLNYHTRLARQEPAGVYSLNKLHQLSPPQPEYLQATSYCALTSYHSTTTNKQQHS